jgi:hypothetical protein
MHFSMLVKIQNPPALLMLATWHDLTLKNCDAAHRGSKIERHIYRNLV